ncbi:hypothetical protein [Mycobacterium sp.]|uniref:hypothetical protein n=1 Tax=Mycobacterium sp. TaxID=1785 RepID=UPI002C24605F|nr:hypothetical protein [Mycobacterium sp.]HME49881.1 hypothetical protein [Mycobacterium sp.]
MGIITPRLAQGSHMGCIGAGSSVGRLSWGTSKRLPGTVVNRCPLGEVQITVPATACTALSG